MIFLCIFTIESTIYLFYTCVFDRSFSLSGSEYHFIHYTSSASPGYLVILCYPFVSHFSIFLRSNKNLLYRKYTPVYHSTFFNLAESLEDLATAYPILLIICIYSATCFCTGFLGPYEDATEDWFVLTLLWAAICFSSVFYCFLMLLLKGYFFTDFLFSRLIYQIWSSSYYCFFFLGRGGTLLLSQSFLSIKATILLTYYISSTLLKYLELPLFLSESMTEMDDELNLSFQFYGILIERLVGCEGQSWGVFLIVSQSYFFFRYSSSISLSFFCLISSSIYFYFLNFYVISLYFFCLSSSSISLYFFFLNYSSISLSFFNLISCSICLSSSSIFSFYFLSLSYCSSFFLFSSSLAYSAFFYFSRSISRILSFYICLSCSSSLFFSLYYISLLIVFFISESLLNNYLLTYGLFWICPDGFFEMMNLLCESSLFMQLSLNFLSAF